jgi:TonB-dependent receptor
VNAGVRVVQTKTTATSAAAAINPDGSVGDPVIFSEDNSYTDILPSTNIIWDLRDDLLVRVNAARNLTRPGLGSLAPTTTSIGTIQGTINSGNPDLDPIRANSLDASLEWYFTEGSVLALTFFQKDIESFITGSVTEGPLSPGLRAVVAARPEYDPNSPVYEPNSVPPDASDWEVSQPVNADGASLEGFELAYQQPFDFLPAPFNNLGVVANYNRVYSRLKQGEFDSALAGLSKNSYNFSLYYETDNYGGRVSINGRDDYLTGVPGGDGNATAGTTGPTRVDLSAFYDITSNLTITLEAINLSDETERLFTTGPMGDHNFVREYNTTGREVYLGVRASF